MNQLADGLEATLAAWVRRRLRDDGFELGRDALACELLAAPPSGNSNVTLPFRISGAPSAATPCDMELVLRMQHPDNQIFLDADVLREHRLLTALAADPTILAPRARWAEPDPAVLGHPFFVMNRVAGTVPAGTPSIHTTGWLAERTEAERATAWTSALEALGAIHRFDWVRHASFLADGASGTTMTQRLDHLGDWYRWVTRGRQFPVTDAGLVHLQATVGDLHPADPVLSWGDARMGNIMFGDDARVAAVLDWELVSVGPPALDLAWWLTFEAFSTTAHGVAPLPGYPDRTATIERYAALSGHTPPDIEWYEVLAQWIITVTVIRMADIGVAAGSLPPDTRMGHGNLTAQMLARSLDVPIPDLDPDYARRRNLPLHRRA